MGGRAGLSALVAAAFVSAAGVAVVARTAGGEESIRAGDLRRHVRFLASDDLGGRDTGEAGVARAEDYVASEFERYGLRPVPGRDEFFLDVTLYRAAIDLERTGLNIELGGEMRSARPGGDFRPFPFSDEGEFEGPIIFAGYGITAPELEYDDYDGLDVVDKFVLLLRHEPGVDDPGSPFDGIRSTDHGLYATKVANAREHGARGMLLVTDPLHHGGADDLRLGGALSLEPEQRGTEPSVEVEGTPFVSAQVSRALAETIVARGGRSLETLQLTVDGGTSPAAIPPLAGVRASLAVHRLDESRPVAARNVAGFLQGADPLLRDEWIVVGGHHDHLGGFAGDGDTVFNGADDNASGTSGVLELAQAFAGAKQPPRRSLVFMTFTAEERGLLGSRAIFADETLPFDRSAFMLNLDMIGRNPKRPVDVVGDGFGRGLRDAVEAANRSPELELSFSGSSYSGNSDHDSFYDREIPFLFLFTGTHEDYHQLGDHPDKLDYRRMQSIVRLAYRVVAELGSAASRPRFVHYIGWLGVSVEVEDVDEGGTLARVTAVEADSRGAMAGLAGGDVIVSFDQIALEDPETVGRRFRDIDPGTSAILGVARPAGPVAIEVQRAKTGYLGVFPGPAGDDVRAAHGLNEGQGIAIREVVPDGPSSRAGLESGDVVISLGGKPVGLGDLRSRLAQIGAGETVTVELLRGDERIQLRLTLGERPPPR